MAAVITRGYTWTTNGVVTNTTLHQLVDNATISGIDQSNLDTGLFSGITISATAPVSPFTGQLWFDSTVGILKYYSGAAFIAVGKGSSFTNKSGGSLTTGDVVIIDTTTDQSITTTTSANNPLAIGVVLDPTLANNAVGTVQTEGVTPAITVTGSTTRGQYLSTGTTAKKATPSSSPNIGTFAISLSASSTTVIAHLTKPTGLSGTANVQAALDGASSPSATNVFMTANAGPKVTVFTANGTFTPTQTGRYKITVTGGGGSGAGSSATGAGGGGAAGTAIGFQSLTASTGYAVVVGAGGSGVGTGNDGSNGVDSTFSGTSTLTGVKGLAGDKDAGLGGAGGSATNGDINLIGGDGVTETGSGLGGQGGASFWGGGSASKVVSTAAGPYGAGSGGAVTANTSSGNGASGIVVVEYVAS